jgi:hypothetical protein
MGRLIALGLFGHKDQAPSGTLDFTDSAIVNAGFLDNAFPYLKARIPGAPGYRSRAFRCRLTRSYLARSMHDQTTYFEC